MTADAPILHPGLFLMGGALLLPWLRGVARDIAVLAAPTFALAALWLLPEGRLLQFVWLDLQLVPLAVDKLSRLFAAAFALAAFAGGLYALRQQSRLELPAAYLYAGAAIGVALAGDIVTVFLCWEIMAIASTLVIWSAATPAAQASSMRYAMVHLFGGVLLLFGVAGHLLATGDATFTRLQPDTLAHWLILAGFLVNAAAPPLSAWLPDAYPEASWSGMVFLSAFTTKAAVYVLLRGFPGTELLVWLGLFMACYGLIYALLESDMRRLLAYVIVNQVGFMMVGIGIGSDMAINGAAAHAVASVFYTALLLMAAGTVLAATGERRLGGLGGLARAMPITAACAVVGGLALSAVPLTAGFVTKTMISQAATDGGLRAAALLLTAVTAGVFIVAGFRFAWQVFFGRDSGLRPAEAAGPMRWAMLLLAALCLLPGIWPGLLYALLPHPVAYVPYTAAHVLVKLALLLGAGLVFFMLRKHLACATGIGVDFDWFYRVAGPRVVQGIGDAWLALRDSIERGLAALAQQAFERLRHEQRPQGWLARSWPTGTMATWVMLMLVAYLAFYYIG